MKSGTIFHAKHAYMPNSLGYCGPDENGTILDHLEGGRQGDKLVRALQGFEAAYPFLKLIARNSGREVFDYEVPEAYWIGNELLQKVSPGDFLKFSRDELGGGGMKSLQSSFKPLGGWAVPHHTFYVFGTYIGQGGSGPSLASDGPKKVTRLMDSCRISWGAVRKVAKDVLMVSYKPLVVEESGLRLGKPMEKTVFYDPRVKPFGSVRPGDVVSIHWNYACELLTRKQAANLARYTEMDISIANKLLAGESGRR